MIPRFDICVNFVLEHETEYNKDGSVKVERDEHDPGGTTKFGIDQRSHPSVNVAALSVAAAKQIYLNGEWTQCSCANLKPGFDLAVFDTAVNIGAGRAIKLLQRAANVTVDGFIGPKTVAAVNAAALDKLSEYINLREAYYKALPATLRKFFLKGWLARLADLRKACGVSASAEATARSAQSQQEATA